MQAEKHPQSHWGRVSACLAGRVRCKRALEAMLKCLKAGSYGGFLSKGEAAVEGMQVRAKDRKDGAVGLGGLVGEGPRRQEVKS